MKKYFKDLSFLLCCFLLLSSCSKDTDNDDPVFTGPSNKEALTVELNGGQLTLEIPAGAMEEGTQISVQESNVELPETAPVLQQFELLPKGTKFLKPVTLTIKYTDEMLQGSSPYALGLAFQNDDSEQWYALVGGKVNTEQKTISTKITHFSHWGVFNALHLYAKTGNDVYHDGQEVIPMLTNQMLTVGVVMDLPPLSADDEEMLKFIKKGFELMKKDPINPKVSEDCPDCALLAPVSFVPPVETDDIHNKVIKPDKWLVNGIANGNTTVGTISEYTNGYFSYTSPAKMPLDNPMAIAAVIHTKSHGELQLIQQANVYARKWRYSYAEQYEDGCDGSYDFDVFGFKAEMKSYVEFGFDDGFSLVGITYHNSPWTISNIENCSPNLTDLTVVPEKDYALRLSNLQKDDEFMDYYPEFGYFYLKMDALYNGNFVCHAISHYNDGSGKTEPFDGIVDTGNAFVGEHGTLIPNKPYTEMKDEAGGYSSSVVVEAIE